MNARDEALVKQAVATIITPGMGSEAVRCAQAALASAGVDEFAAVAAAQQEAAALRNGSLRKDSAPGGRVVVSAPLGDGGKLQLDMAPAEALSLVGAVQDALYRRH